MRICVGLFFLNRRLDVIVGFQDFFFFALLIWLLQKVKSHRKVIRKTIDMSMHTFNAYLFHITVDFVLNLNFDLSLYCFIVGSLLVMFCQIKALTVLMSFCVHSVGLYCINCDFCHSCTFNGNIWWSGNSLITIICYFRKMSSNWATLYHTYWKYFAFSVK